MSSREKSITIYDIATRAKVSVSTVSRVINNSRNVADRTREHVERIMAECSYYPNDMARGLVHNSMKIIGVLASDIRNVHFSNTSYVLENCFFSWDYNTILCNTGDDINKKKKYIIVFSRKKIDALVLVGSVFNDKKIETMIGDYLPNTPVIISNSTLSIPNSYSVLADHDHGMDVALAHLVDKGHTHIAFVHTGLTYNTQRKIEGFIKAMARYNLPYAEHENLFLIKPDIASARACADTIAKQHKKLSAVLFSDDLFALSAINIWKEHGIRIPEDIAVIGHDNSIFAQCSEPQLTTIDTKVETIANIIANTLHNIFQKKDVGQSTIVRPELVIRKST